MEKEPSGNKRPRVGSDEDTQDLFEKSRSREMLSSVIFQNIQSPSKSNKANLERQHQAQRNQKCEACSKLRDDKRNEYFTFLLLEELKYINLCMRSRAYVKILNFLNSLKNDHTDELELTETEKC